MRNHRVQRSILAGSRRVTSTRVSRRSRSPASLVAALTCLLLAVCSFAAGIPEPPPVWYGQVRNNAGGQSARITSGTLAWTIVPAGGGTPIVLTTQLTNVNDQFSYVLFVPCESELAGLSISGNTLKLANPNVAYTRTDVKWNGQPLVLKDPAQGSFTLSAATRGKVERIDLGLGQFLPDGDSDGLPDWWEAQYPLAGDPNADQDGDGLSNLKEYVAGTNPQDSASSIEFVNVMEESPGVVLVEWSSVPGKGYSVLRSPILSTDPADYELIQSGIASQGAVTRYRDTSAMGNWFYRVRVAE